MSTLKNKQSFQGATSASNTRSAVSPANSNIPATKSSSNRKSLVSESNSKRRSSNISNKDKEPSESNISVYVRCRSRNDREIKENSGVVVSTLGHKGKEVILQTGPMAISSKTYAFDKVYGAESDQELVFEGIAKNLLDEVLEGFNCTVFAYGQTGTGKTYTMSGDIGTNKNGQLNEDAGIIPRTLVSLFKQLEDFPDFSVKVSFIELYNEELRDLLVLDPAFDKKVKIYDDPNKKSIMVQGMEEIYITTAKEGLELLNDGSIKRQVAATQCNDLSSRSHTVFTITVHMKLIDPNSGEEMLKTGKLNLVDLAGSENISRSGAENKRAREAGMINQSLLTLGRVINALVEQSPHIPYRESKLTRLLQDSLGGKTKTCLIATISPAKVSLDETLSTLEYAYRARNIKNKPQANSVLSKQLMIKEYIEEIERLRNDLNATRSKNGIYITEENLNQITQESESRRIQIDEQRLRIELLDDQIKNFKANYESNLELFSKNEKKLQATEFELERTTKKMKETENELFETRNNLNDEIAIRVEHEKTETQLKNIGVELIKLLDSVIAAKNELYEIIKKKKDTDFLNFETFSKNKLVVDATERTLKSSFVEAKSVHDQIFSMNKGVNDIFFSQNNEVSELMQYMLHASSDFSTNINTTIEKIEDNARLLDNNIDGINTLKEEIKDQVSKELTNLKNNSKKFFEVMSLHISDIKISISSSYKDLGNQFVSLVEVVQEQLQKQEEEIDELKNQLSDHTKESHELVMNEQQRISHFMQSEKQKIEEEEEELLMNITSMIQKFSTSKKRRLDDKVSELHSSLEHISKKGNHFSCQFENSVSNWSTSQTKFKALLDDEKSRMDDEVVEKEKISSEFIKGFQSDVSKEEHKFVSSIEKNVSDLDSKMSSLDDFATKLKEANSKSTVSTSKSLQETALKSKDCFMDHNEKLSKCQSTYNDLLQKMNQFHKGQVNSFGNYESIVAHISTSLRAVADESVFIKEASEYPITKTYQYPKNIPITRDHGEIVMERRAKAASEVKNSSNETYERVNTMEIDADEEKENSQFNSSKSPPLISSYVAHDQRSRHKKSTSLSRSGSVLSSR